MGDRESRRLAGVVAGLVVAASVVFLVLHNRGGATYDLRFGTAFSDAEALALIAAAVVAAVLLAGARWATAVLVSFAVLTLVLGVVHPCRIAFQSSPRFDACSVSAVATALGLYAPIGAVVSAAAGRLAARVARTGRAAATLAGASAVAVLLALFLPWSRATDEGREYTDSGWQVFQRFDVYLAVTAVLALVLAATTLLGRRRATDLLAPAVSLLAVTAAGIAFYRLFTVADSPSSGYAPLPAAYLALGALVAVAFASHGSPGDRGGSHGRRETPK